MSSDALIFGESLQEKKSRKQAQKLGMPNKGMDIADVKTFVDEYTALDKTNNWQQMSMSTATGAAATTGNYIGACFDGEYMYFAPFKSDTFVRFDTQGTSFLTAADWITMSMSTAQGAAALDYAYVTPAFDGRYVYYCPQNADTFLRYDTQGTSFVTAGDWTKMNLSTAQGAALLDSAYMGTIYDGRYVYYCPYHALTFLRFDTQGTSFTTAGDWQKIATSTAIGGAGAQSHFRGVCFDGRYIYFSPHNASSFVRFDTQGTSWTTAGDWQQMDMSTALGAARLESAYWGTCFDGRYVYFSPHYSDSFIRFNTQGTSFTTATDWETMSMSTAQGAAASDADYVDVTFDGRYVYFCPYNGDTFLRFDTQGTSFATAADWTKISMSTAQGAAAVNAGFWGGFYDGKYIYFSSYNTITFVRVLAAPKV